MKGYPSTNSMLSSKTSWLLEVFCILRLSAPCLTKKSEKPSCFDGFLFTFFPICIILIRYIKTSKVTVLKCKDFSAGLKASLPVFIGYFAVSFGFGTLAVSKGLKALEAALISLTNVTSAGQFAGLAVIAAGGPLLDLILTQLVINSRYALMSLALGQKMGKRFGIGLRLLTAFYNTDEIFALAMAKPASLTVPYVLGLGVLPIVGWTGGTLLGALAGSILPDSMTTALGVALYGMFVAIVVPQAQKSRPILTAVAIAIGLSCLFRWVPVLNTVSEGLSIVISTVIAAAACAILFPIPDEEEREAAV